MTTHLVRLKLFRLKAEEVRKARLTHVGAQRAGFRTKHGFKMGRIPIFPNSLQPSAYTPGQLQRLVIEEVLAGLLLKSHHLDSTP